MARTAGTRAIISETCPPGEGFLSVFSPSLTVVTEPESGSGRHSRSISRWWHKPASAGVVLVAAVLTGGGAVAAGALTSQGPVQAAITQQRATLVAQNDEAVRVKRAEVYSQYLAAADQYSIQTGNLLNAGRNLPPSGGALPEAVTTAWSNARSSYQDQVNQVYVYGSDAAWAAHQRVAAVLPAAVLRVEVKDVDSLAFISAYQGFQDILCRELVPTPRAGCGAR